MRRLAIGLVGALLLAAACTSANHDAPPLRIGAVYPLTGPQGPSGGVLEFRGVQIATQLVNADGGVDGRQVELLPVDAPSADAAPGAVDDLASRGVRLVLGSYGSTISEPAAIEATDKGMLFWENGAVGEMAGDGPGRNVFRVAPSGAVLGRNAVRFISDVYAPMIHRDPSTLRWAITLVDDSYGHAVAQGAIDELRSRGYPIAGIFPYDPNSVDMDAFVKKVGASHPDVLFASAYVNDAVAMRRAMVREGVDVTAGIGTSSSYCMLAFGQRLGADAVGLFASDKPASDAINPDGLTTSGRALLERASAAYRARFGGSMSAAALAGFSGAWALLHDVLPNASSPTTPSDVAAAALKVDLPTGSLPNGSGLRFGAPGTAMAGANELAQSVIWEWTSPGERWVVWPERYATYEIEPLDPLP